jgi:hypothetical protein
MTKREIIRVFRANWHLLESTASKSIDTISVSIYNSDTPNIYEVTDPYTYPVVTFKSIRPHFLFTDRLYGKDLPEGLPEELDIFRNIRGNIDKLQITKPTYHELANELSTDRQEA